MKRFLNNIIQHFCDAKIQQKDAGYLIQNVILIASFAIVALAVTGLIGNAIIEKGVDEVDCINSSGGYSANGEILTAC